MEITKQQINRITVKIESLEADLGELSLASDRKNGEGASVSLMLNTALQYLSNSRETLEFGELKCEDTE